MTVVVFGGGLTSMAGGLTIRRNNNPAQTQKDVILPAIPAVPGIGLGSRRQRAPHRSCMTIVSGCERDSTFFDESKNIE
ncbi:MAG TPA: hypothetical protein VKA08_10930 [Balneolales bacterium]|nr:hypothetical protein [Balneolales bacterium]